MTAAQPRRMPGQYWRTFWKGPHAMKRVQVNFHLTTGLRILTQGSFE